MGILWSKYKQLSGKRRQTLHSLGAGFVLFGFLFILTKIFSVSLCPIKNIFGISCFGCGMTRGFISVLKFDFNTAFKYNVLSIPVFFGILLYSILFLADFLCNTNYVSMIEKQLAKKYMYLIYIIILTVSTVMNNLYLNI